MNLTDADLLTVFALIGDDSTARIRVAFGMAEDHETRVRVVESAIDWIAQEFTKTKQNRRRKTEDEISTDVVSLLKSMGFKAAHDTQFGGHCDVIVEGKDEFLWIGEAKIHTSYKWLEKGFEQLDSRYSTGLYGQDAGEVLVYTYSPRLDRIMSTWATRLSKARPDVKVQTCPLDPLNLRSVHIHKATGREFHVRHKGITLYFDPKA